jgi:hypothetical protein
MYVSFLVRFGSLCLWRNLSNICSSSLIIVFEICFILH